MTTKNEAELLDYEGDLTSAQDQETDPAETDPWPEWNGRSSKIALAFPGVMRDFVITGPQEPCLDCAKSGRRDRSHQFHVKASKTADGRWVGPEGDHLMDLKANGLLLHTKEAADRAERQREVDDQRGVHPSTRCRGCGKALTREDAICPQCGLANGQPSLAAWTLGQHKRNWHPVLKGGPEGAREIETGQIRSEQRELAAAVKTGLAEGLEPLAEAIRELLAGKEAK
jgi:hypothetical protein